MKNPFSDCEGCKERRAKMVETLKEMASKFRNPNAIPVQAQPIEPVKSPSETESKSGK